MANQRAEDVLIIPGLSDELSLYILSKLPLWKMASLRCVCRRWHRASLQPSISHVFLLLSCETCVTLNSNLSRRLLLLDPLSGARMFLPPLIDIRDLSNVQVESDGRNIIVLDNRIIDSHLCVTLFCFNLDSNRWHHWPVRRLPGKAFVSSTTLAADGFLYGTLRYGAQLCRLNFGEALRKSLMYASATAAAGDGYDMDAEVPILEWESLLPFQKNRSANHPAVAYCNGRIYVLGGEGTSLEEESAFPKKVKHFSGEVWDPSMQAGEEWTLVPELWPSKFFKDDIVPCVAVIEGHLCAFSTVTRHILRYQEDTKHWTPWIPLPRQFGPRSFFVIGNAVWVLYTQYCHVGFKTGRLWRNTLTVAKLPDTDILGMESLKVRTDESWIKAVHQSCRMVSSCCKLHRFGSQSHSSSCNTFTFTITGCDLHIFMRTLL